MPLFAEGGNLGLLNLPFKGLMAGDKFGSAVGIAAFLLRLGGSFGVLMHTGAIDRSLTGFVARFEHRMEILIPGLFLLFSLGGAISGMGEENHILRVDIGAGVGVGVWIWAFGGSELRPR